MPICNAISRNLCMWFVCVAAYIYKHKQKLPSLDRIAHRSGLAQVTYKYKITTTADRC